jgi:hypothetical protein
MPTMAANHPGLVRGLQQRAAQARGMSPTPRRVVKGLITDHGGRAQIICDATRDGITLHHSAGRSERITQAERALVHSVLERQLTADWPPYIRRLEASGMLEQHYERE